MDTLDNSRPEIIACSDNKRESSLKEFSQSDEWGTSLQCETELFYSETPALVW